jgi:hypothetical protein
MSGRQGANRTPSDPCAGDESESHPLVVARRQQDRHEQAAERQDRDAGSAGEGREERTGEDGDDRGGAAQRPGPGPQQPHKAARRARRGHDEACEREERQRREQRVHDLVVVVEGHRGDGVARAYEENERDTREACEERRAEQRRDGERDERRQPDCGKRGVELRRVKRGRDRDHENRCACAVARRRVRREPQRNEGEAGRHRRLERDARHAEGELARHRRLLRDELPGRDRQDCGDGGRDEAREDLDGRLPLGRHPLEKCAHRE